jgi:hypothetical protein
MKYLFGCRPTPELVLAISDEFWLLWPTVWERMQLTLNCDQMGWQICFCPMAKKLAPRQRKRRAIGVSHDPCLV